MNDNFLIQLLKIIKQSKQPIIKAFEDDSSRASYIDFNSVLKDIQNYTKRLSKSIKKKLVHLIRTMRVKSR